MGSMKGHTETDLPVMRKYSNSLMPLVLHTTNKERPIIPSTLGQTEQSNRDICSGHVAAPTAEEFDNQSPPCSELNDNTNTIQQSSPITDTALPASALAPPRQGEVTSLHLMTDDEAFSKTSLATCDDITFSPNTKKLLESCKTNLGGFLQAIREAKVSLPTGQGWEAAIATKKENVDIRDLMKIYHRFECHNIYRHIVEAELHTGTHWIRDMRTALANKLCQDFPERFQDQKAANKCLNWVDQGCRYQEWAEMFNEKTDLGYLIALPSDVSHSAFVSLLALPENVVSRKLHRYTSRCTKEQMNAAVLKFKCLGIDRIVKDMGLTQLGNHIAATLREMTGRKRKDVDHIFGHAESSMPDSAQDQPGIHGQQGSNTSNAMDDCAVIFEPFNGMALPPSPPGQNSGH
ncbi:hypothetical protein N7494_009286 [Penicillium frequentans]|uniref:Uncharacterized protein n=1 Tax=Penicillium frequentans TaxID=3151616 RepID=A0AAD6CPR4_9EURO|nr:hypothetical protein N7494_009286 [Penicillium glabrum]